MAHRRHRSVHGHIGSILRGEDIGDLGGGSVLKIETWLRPVITTVVIGVGVVLGIGLLNKGNTWYETNVKHAKHPPTLSDQAAAFIHAL